jgi:2,3-bisphosphoglycerate-dependent phosphoglycerate mutase
MPEDGRRGGRSEQPIYLLRHGESVWNVLRLTQGQTRHPPLTERGREQSRQAALIIADDLARAGSTVGLVVSSDLVRAVQTARIIQATVGGELCTDWRLREQDLGHLEGRGYDAAEAAAAAHDWSDPDLPLAGGESPRQVQERVAQALAGLDPGQVTVVVSHGDTIKLALAHLQGVGPNRARGFEVANGAVARIGPYDTVTWLASPAPTADHSTRSTTVAEQVLP